MAYNPIFEEETDRQTRKTEFNALKKEIKKRARRVQIKSTINRVYNLLKRTPITNWLNSGEGLVNNAK